MKEELLQIKQNIIDISNDLKTNLADKGVTADGTLSELVDKVLNIDSNVLAEIGWNIAEQPFLKDAIDYAKEILANPKSTYKGDKQLVIFPYVLELVFVSDMFNESSLSLFPLGVIGKGVFTNAFRYTGITYIDISEWEIKGDCSKLFEYCGYLSKIRIGEGFGKDITNMTNLFAYNYNLLEIDGSFDLSNCTSTYYLFEGAKSIKAIDVSKGNTNKLINAYDTFYGCRKLEYLKLSEDFGKFCTNYSYFINGCDCLLEVIGSISFKSVGNVSTMGTGPCHKLLIKDIGTNSNSTSLNLGFSKWGQEIEGISNARQSLIDSLITFSFDRVAAGYETCKITLNKNTKALLTEDEIAQITAKGYTLV